MRLSKTALRLGFAAALVFAVGLAGAEEDTVPADVPDELQESVERAVEEVKPALVRIQVVSTRYTGGRAQRYLSSGSGVIISSDGYVITNHHVAARAQRIRCTLTTKEEIDAELVGTDALSDIAILRLLPEEPREFPVARFGDSGALKVGDNVLAMGSPMALSQSVTLGIVSNLEVTLGRDAVTLDGENVGTMVRWIGHDAAIFGGNSGGPLVNLRGEIIGINEIAIGLGGGLGGAIPGNFAQEVAEALMEHGEVERAWMGVQVQPLLRRTGPERGVLISGAFHDSPADRAGFEAGDILIRLGGEEIEVRFDEELPLFNQYSAGLPIGEEVEAVVLRDDEEVTLTLTPERREPVAPDQQEFRQWGMTARDLSFIKAREMRRDTRDGVLVTSVRSGGPVGEARPSLNSDDVIVGVNGVNIENVEELVSLTELITEEAEGPVPALVTFERRGEQHVTVVSVGIREIDDPGREVRRAWLPLEAQVVTSDIADKLGQEGLNGFRVTRVHAGLSAEEAGLQVGDVIVAVDGEPLYASRPEDYEELTALIRQYRIGDEAELGIVRNGEEIALAVELTESPRAAREMVRYEDLHFEFTVRDLTFQDRAQEQWSQDQAGVLVEDVRNGSWSDLGELRTSDLIVRVDGYDVEDVENFQEIMERIEGEQPSAVVFKVMRGVYTLFLEIEPQWDEVV